MKNQKILLIIVALLVVIGGVWFVARDKDGAGNEVAMEDNEDDMEEAEDQTDQADQEDPEDREDEEEDVQPDIAVGAPAPDFTLENLDGEPVSLSDYKGKIVLLNFWATWCGFCDKEMPDLMKLNNEFEDVAVLAVDVMEDKSTVADYIEEGGYDFDVVLDLEGQVSRTYYINPLPTSYFIEEDGTLIGRIEGMLEYDQMVQIIENIKAER